MQPPEERPDVLVVGSVIQNVIEDALGAAIIDSGEHTERSVLELIGGHIPRKINKGPVKDVLKDASEVFAKLPPIIQQAVEITSKIQANNLPQDPASAAAVRLSNKAFGKPEI